MGTQRPLHHPRCEYKGYFLLCSTPFRAFLFRFGSHHVEMCRLACSSPVESRFHKWWELPAAPLHSGSLLLVTGAVSPVETDALIPGLPAKLTSLGSFSLTLIFISCFARLHLNMTLLIRLLSIIQTKL